MSLLQNISEKFRPHPTDVNGIDFGASGTKIVRVRKNGEALSLAGVDVLPAIDCRQSDLHPSALNIPAKLRAHYAAVCLNSPGISIKLLTLPGAIDATFDQKLAHNLGLAEDTPDRLGYRTILEGTGRAESRILAVGLPEPEASNCMNLFTAGLPAPWHLAAAPIAALTAFEAGPVKTAGTNAIGLIDFSYHFCSFSIFFKKSLILLRRFDFGMEKVFNKITASLNVDHRTASNILADGAFDVSDLLHDIMQPLFSQVIVSRDFIERRENCSINTLFLSGTFATSDAAMQQMERALNVSVVPWDPFDLPQLSMATPLPPEHDKQRWRFAAALGAAMATIEEDK